MSLRRSLPPRSPLVPYTTLFRSGIDAAGDDGVGQFEAAVGPVGDGHVGLPVAGEVQVVLALTLGHRRCPGMLGDRKSTRLNSSHVAIAYAVFCLKKKKVRKRAET